MNDQGNAGSMRGLLRRLEESVSTGLHESEFEPVKGYKKTGSKGPDARLVAHLNKAVSVEIEYSEGRNGGWAFTIFDRDADEESNHDYIVGGETLRRGITQDEAEEVAFKSAWKYLSDKRRKE
jgi:hypothetical protein